MQELDQVIADATRAIAPEYFRLPIDGGDPIFRERVYCYELYHQMRLLWPADCRFRLNGEVDKSAHPILSSMGAAYAKPDLLVHTPGAMNGNHAIFEIKSCSADLNGIKKDVRTLSRFVRDVGYQRAIYLVYGDALDRIANKIRVAAAALNLGVGIELWLHHQAGVPAEPRGTV